MRYVALFASIAMLASVALAPPGEAGEAGCPDGASGMRVQVVYAHLDGEPNRVNDFRAEVVDKAAEVDARFVEHARAVRYVVDGECVPVVDVALWDGSNLVDYPLRDDRNYLVLVDGDGRGFARGTWPHDDKPGLDNRSAEGRSLAVVFQPWSVFVMTHELVHALGAVKHSAPYTTGKQHCSVLNDVMCYDDGGDYEPHDAGCTGKVLDCVGDVYFNTDPEPGSYLAGHWNVADSPFLHGGQVPAPEPDAQQWSYQDTDGNTHQEAIEELSRRGIVEGHGDGTYRPDDPVTRGQMASMLWRMYQHMGGE